MVLNIRALLMKPDPFDKRYLDVIDKVNTLKKENKPVDENTAGRYETIQYLYLYIKDLFN